MKFLSCRYPCSFRVFTTWFREWAWCSAISSKTAATNWILSWRRDGDRCVAIGIKGAYSWCRSWSCFPDISIKATFKRGIYGWFRLWNCYLTVIIKAASSTPKFFICLRIAYVRSVKSNQSINQSANQSILISTRDICEPKKKARCQKKCTCIYCVW